MAAKNTETETAAQYTNYLYSNRLLASELPNNFRGLEQNLSFAPPPQKKPKLKYHHLILKVIICDIYVYHEAIYIVLHQFVPYSLILIFLIFYSNIIFFCYTFGDPWTMEIFTLKYTHAVECDIEFRNSTACTLIIFIIVRYCNI